MFEALIVRCYRRNYAYLLWPLSLATSLVEGAMSARLSAWFYALFAYGINLEPELKVKTMKQTMPYLLELRRGEDILSILREAARPNQAIFMRSEVLSGASYLFIALVSS